jgi:hypothetical protein
MSFKKILTRAWDFAFFSFAMYRTLDVTMTCLSQERGVTNEGQEEKALEILMKKMESRKC